MKLLSEEKLKKINDNIPKARRTADQYIKRYGYMRKTWSRVYHETMDKLCKADGVRQ